jgi:preprotein translocase subunit SecG
MQNIYAVLLVIHLIAAVSMIILILIQPSEAGGFVGSGSMSNLMAPRRTADLMTRLTTSAAGCFFVTSLLLAISANHHPQARSILDVDTGAPVKQRSNAPTPPNSLSPTTAPAPTPAPTTDNKDNGKTDSDKTNSSKTKDKKHDGGVPKAPQTE